MPNLTGKARLCRISTDTRTQFAIARAWNQSLLVGCGTESTFKGALICLTQNVGSWWRHLLFQLHLYNSNVPPGSSFWAVSRHWWCVYTVRHQRCGSNLNIFQIVLFLHSNIFLCFLGFSFLQIHGWSVSKWPTILPPKRTWKRWCQRQVSCTRSFQMHFVTLVQNADIKHRCTEDVVVPSSRASQRSSRDSEDHDSEIGHEPIQERYGNPSNSRFRRVASKTVVSFGLNDPENPVNWRNVRSPWPLTQIACWPRPEKEIPRPRFRCHASLEQHNWLFNL